MIHNIEYLNWTFTPDKIREGNLHLVTSLLSSALEVNTLFVVVECTDPSILDFERNTPLLYYTRPDQPMVFRVQHINRAGPGIYEISATSTLGLLTEGLHYGGIYTGQTAQEVIASICGAVPFILKSNLVETKLYGWLPIASPRDNLSQVLFALGAALKTDLDGVLRIAGLWDGASGTVGRDDIYQGANVDYAAKVTSVAVTEHQYAEGAETAKLFEGTAQEGDIITFNEPMHSLTAEGFTVLESGANYARVSAGSGTLTGKKYIHNTRLITRAVQTANTPNVKTVDKATLVSLVNSAAVAGRLAAFYACTQTIDAPVVYSGENPGDVLSIYHPYDKSGVSSCLQSADITLSNTLKAQEKSLVGFEPEQIADIEILDKRVIFTESGSWTAPDGSTRIIAVIIGPGQDGQDGQNGEDGKSGTGATAPQGAERDTHYSGTYGAGGKGGEPGSPGEGGKILQINLDVVGRQEFSVDINATETTFSSLNVTYSSENGSRNPNGYIDITTGITYAKRGLDGVRGADGGHGGGRQIESENGKPVETWLGGLGGKQGYSSHTEYVSGVWGRGGGGAALGENGYDGLPQTGTEGTLPYGGKGATALQQMQRTEPGSGGNGGSGGGGGGGGGAGQIDVRKTLSRSITVSGGQGGSKGYGAKGGSGVLGCVIIYYGVPRKIQSGQFADKNGKRFLDKFIRRFVV